MTRVNDALRRASAALADAVLRARAEKQAFAQNKNLLKGFLTMLDSTLSEKDDMWLDMWGTNPCVTVSMRGLEGFKSPRLTKVLSLLEDLGELQRTEDWAQYLSRDYTYMVGSVKVQICVYVENDSPTCRRVQIGTEVREVPKYKIECD